MSSVYLCRFVRVVTSDSCPSSFRSIRVVQKALRSFLFAIRATSPIQPALQASHGSYDQSVYAGYVCRTLKSATNRTFMRSLANDADAGWRPCTKHSTSAREFVHPGTLDSSHAVQVGIEVALVSHPDTWLW